MAVNSYRPMQMTCGDGSRHLMSRAARATANQGAAMRVRRHVRSSGAAFILLAGPPGAGKTALVDATLRLLAPTFRAGIIVTNPAADRDADVLRSHCVRAIPLRAATPDPVAVADAVESFDRDRLDLLILETCGGIVPLPSVGEDAVVAVLGVSGGDDKAAEYRHLLVRSSAVILTKTDLLPYIRFRGQVFHEDVRQINPRADVMELSVINGHGMDPWLRWLSGQRSAARRQQLTSECGAELFVG